MDNQGVKEFHCVYGALRKNERLKLYKKPSTWIMIGIIVVIFQLFLLLSYFTVTHSGSFMSTMWQESYKSDINQYAIQLKDNPNQPSIQSKSDSLTYLLDNKIPPSDWRTDVVEEYYNLKYGLSTQTKTGADNELNSYMGKDAAQGQMPPANQNTLTPEQTQQQMNKLQTILNANDWKAYIHQKIADLNSGVIASANQSEKQVDIDICNMYLDNDIVPVSSSSLYSGMQSDTNENWKSLQVQNIRQCKLNLLRGENAQGALLSNSQRQEYQKSIDVAQQRLISNIKPVAQNSFYGVLGHSANYMYLLSIALIIVAGGLISNEYSTGTVKLLLISPHKRQKIFWAKTLLLVEVSLILVTAVFLLSFLISGALYGFKGIADMQVLHFFGRVVQMPYLVYLILQYLLMMLPVLVYGSMALMFSAVARKGSISIAVPILLMLGGSIITSILAQNSGRFVVPGIKFLLFSNTSLENYLPAVGSSMSSGASGIMVDNTMTLGFSVAVLLVYMACFLWIARDSFCRRDVK